VQDASIARSRQATVESYTGSSVSTSETSTPAVLRRKRPVMTPSGRTKKLAQQDSRAEELGQPIPSTARTHNTPKVRFSATLGREPEVEVALL
jgi:hypothetical protein